jgi:hypothetical protein
MVSPIKDDKGDIIGAPKIARDIAECRRAERVRFLCKRDRPPSKTCWRWRKRRCISAEPKLSMHSKPQLLLEPNTAQSMAVAVHELATNAVNYGALSSPTDHLLVEWSLGIDDGSCSVGPRCRTKRAP